MFSQRESYGLDRVRRLNQDAMEGLTDQVFEHTKDFPSPSRPPAIFPLRPCQTVQKDFARSISALRMAYVWLCSSRGFFSQYALFHGFGDEGGEEKGGRL